MALFIKLLEDKIAYKTADNTLAVKKQTIDTIKYSLLVLCSVFSAGFL